MAKRADELIIDSLAHNWNAVGITAAGTTCVASSTPLQGTDKTHLTQIGWSIRNAAAAAYTATLNVRCDSAAGNVVASWDIICPVGSSLQDSWNVNYMSVKGGQIVVDFGTPLASVVQKVSIAGWHNQSTN